MLSFIKMDSKEIIINNIFNYCKFLIGFILFTEVVIQGINGSFINNSEYLELMQQRSGCNISLQCSLKGIEDGTNTADITYDWYFKKYVSSGIFNYETNDNKVWTRLPCQSNICKSELQLENVTENYSGLYKCTVMPKSSNILNVRLVKTFQLVVKDLFLKVPKFLDGFPRNKTINSRSQVAFQCRVYSEEYLSIKWFRRLPNFKYSSYENIHSAIYHNGQVYELLLTSANEKYISRNVYLSKLLINDVQQQDEGFYACVAISLWGHNVQEAYLKVNVSNNDIEYWSDYSEEDEDFYTHSKEFWLILLMRAGLALLPFFVCLCYIMYNRYQSLTDRFKYLKSSDRQCILKT